MTQKAPTYLRGARVRKRAWRLRTALRGLVAILFGALDKIAPKRKGRVVLGCDKGLKFNGNPRALFEHMRDTGNQGAYWLSNDPRIVQEVNSRWPGSAHLAWSMRGLWLGLTSRWLCVSHSRYDLGPFAFLPGPRFLYLTHGTPLKSMGFAKQFDDPASMHAAESFGAVTCCSSFEGSLWERAYRLDPGRMWVTGVARNDRLFERSPEVIAPLRLPAGRKLVLFAPTYRETGLLADYLPAPAVDAGELIALLEKHDATLLVRPHYYERDAAAKTIDRLNSDRFVSADETLVPDVNDLLAHVDVLITDYSSIYIDYLLLDRPVIFSCHDVEEYSRTRGFMIDYQSYTPGAKARDGQALLSALEKELRGDDPFAEARARVRQLFHHHLDGHSSERIAARIAAG